MLVDAVIGCFSVVAVCWFGNLMTTKRDFFFDCHEVSQCHRRGGAIDFFEKTLKTR